MAGERRSELDALIKRRDTLKEALQRAKGRKDAAVKERTAVEDECLKRGIAPDQLEGAIEKLTTKYDSEVQAFCNKLQKAEEAIKPFLGES